MAPGFEFNETRDLKHWAVVLLGGIGLASVVILILEWDRGPHSPESDPLIMNSMDRKPAPALPPGMNTRPSPAVRPPSADGAKTIAAPLFNLPVGADPEVERARYEEAMALLEKGEALKEARKWSEAARVYEQIVAQYPVVHDPDQDFIEVHLTEELAPEIAYFRCLRDAPAAPSFDSVDSLARKIQDHVRKGETGRLARMLDRCGMFLGEGDGGRELMTVMTDAAEAWRQIIGAIERNRDEMLWSEAEVTRFGIEVPAKSSDATYYFVFQTKADRWTWSGFRRIPARGADRSAASVR